MIKGSSQEEYIAIVNIYAPNTEALLPVSSPGASREFEAGTELAIKERLIRNLKRY